MLLSWTNCICIYIYICFYTCVSLTWLKWIQQDLASWINRHRFRPHWIAASIRALTWAPPSGPVAISIMAWMHWVGVASGEDPLTPPHTPLPLIYSPQNKITWLAKTFHLIKSVDTFLYISFLYFFCIFFSVFCLCLLWNPVLAWQLPEHDDDSVFISLNS